MTHVESLGAGPPLVLLHGWGLHAGLFSPLRCIAAVEAATRLPLAEGLKCERELFTECLNSPQRGALIHSFFAERQAGKIDDLPSDVTPRPIRSSRWRCASFAG